MEFLLELGDKFEIQFVIDECERFLMSTEDIAIVTKLVWADQYCLAKLQVGVRFFSLIPSPLLIAPLTGCLCPDVQDRERHQGAEAHRGV